MSDEHRRQAEVPAPYEGLRVIDLSDRPSGAFAARLFGDFGANVILVEPPEGHPLRREPPFLDDGPGPERGVLHAYFNWNKRSIVAKDDADLKRLLATADVLVTSDSRDRVEALHPLLSDHAVHLSVTAHGLEGSLADRPGNNLTTCARAGWSGINGYRDEPPLALPHDQSGYVGGVAGFLAAAAALRRRAQAAEAELVDVRELEALALTVHPWGIAAIYNDAGYCNGPAGRRPRDKPAPLWDLADGRMHFGIADFRNWQAAMDVLELPALGAQAHLIPDLGRHSQNLAEVVQGMARTLPRLERWPVFHALAELRCVIGVLQDVADLKQNEQILAREFLVETRIDGRPVQAAGAPAKLFPSPWRLRRAAPGLDEHAEAIRRELRAAATETSPSALAVPVPRPDKPAGKGLADGPLSGLRVLSFGQAWSGTFGTELLALLGADVVQIGSLHRPDVWRRTAGQVPAGIADSSRRQHPFNTQGLYNSVNLNKREITLDLSQDRGRELLWELIPRFDVLVDNFRPSVMPGWGISLEKLHELKPGMIWASISGYGATGPYAAYPANGATTEPMAGFSSVHGYAGDKGMNTGGLYPDPIGGYCLAATLMAALAHRDRTGLPQRIDLSMMEAVSTIIGDAIVAHGATGRMPAPIGNQHPRIAPHNHYACADGEWLALAAESDAAWAALVAEIGDPRLESPEFARMEDRKAHEARLDAIIGAWCATRDAAALENRLGAQGLHAARLTPLYELYSRPDPDFVANGFVSRVDHPETGPTWLPGRPWRFSAAPAAAIRHAPCVGQHSREVLVGELGLSESEYSALVAAGVTGTLYDERPSGKSESRQ